jgi:hypothetical protein
LIRRITIRFSFSEWLWSITTVIRTMPTYMAGEGRRGRAGARRAG